MVEFSRVVKHKNIRQKTSTGTLIHRVVYVFFSGIFFLFGIFLVIASVNVFFSGTDEVSQAYILGFFGLFSVFSGLWMGKKSLTYNYEQYVIETKKTELEQRQVQIENEIRKRENNPYLANTHDISFLSTFIVLLISAILGLFWYYSRDQVIGWAALIGVAIFILFSSALDLDGKKVTELEKWYIDLVVFTSQAIKWISAIVIGLLIISAIVGWVSSLSATTIIIFLLILILLKRR